MGPHPESDMGIAIAKVTGRKQCTPPTKTSGEFDMRTPEKSGDVGDRPTHGADRKIEVKRIALVGQPELVDHANSQHVHMSSCAVGPSRAQRGRVADRSRAADPTGRQSDRPRVPPVAQHCYGTRRQSATEAELRVGEAHADVAPRYVHASRDMGRSQQRNATGRIFDKAKLTSADRQKRRLARGSTVGEGRVRRGLFSKKRSVVRWWLARTWCIYKFCSLGSWLPNGPSWLGNGPSWLGNGTRCNGSSWLGNGPRCNGPCWLGNGL